MVSVVLLGVFIIITSFVLSLGRFLNCLIVLENLNVLLLVSSLLFLGERRVLFLILIVIFTIEVTLSLVVLTRLWDYRELVDVTSF